MFVVFVATQYDLTLERYLYTTDMILTLAPLSAKSAMRNFQDEQRMDLYESSPGVMSTSYQEYLNWVSSRSAYLPVVTELTNKFSEGLNPTNYAMPYLDKDKLTEEFHDLYSQQLQSISANTYADIEAMSGKVKSISRSIDNFSSKGVMWGLGSSFYTNTTGHNRLYDYDNYITYNVTFEVEVIIDIKYGITNISAGKRRVVHEFTMLYELVN